MLADERMIHDEAINRVQIEIENQGLEINDEEFREIVRNMEDKIVKTLMDWDI